MKVFISWSGPRSQRVAEIFHVWLPSVLQAIVPYFTPSDIDKGTRWASDIAGQLELSDVGLLMLTPENTSAPWMMFEAGALSKKLDASKVCPILFEMEPSDLKGPLTQFQSTLFNKSDILRLITILNQSLGEQAVKVPIFDNIFETFWPSLESQVADAMKLETGKTAEPKRKDRDIMEEMLELTRTMAVQISQVEKSVRPFAQPVSHSDIRPSEILWTSSENLQPNTPLVNAALAAAAFTTAASMAFIEWLKAIYPSSLIQVSSFFPDINIVTPENTEIGMEILVQRDRENLNQLQERIKASIYKGNNLIEQDRLNGFIVCAICRRKQIADQLVDVLSQQKPQLFLDQIWVGVFDGVDTFSPTKISNLL